MSNPSIWNMVFLRNGDHVDLSSKGIKVQVSSLGSDMNDLVCVGTYWNCGKFVIVATQEGLDRWDGGNHTIPGVAFPEEEVRFERAAL